MSCKSDQQNIEIPNSRVISQRGTSTQNLAESAFSPPRMYVFHILSECKISRITMTAMSNCTRAAMFEMK
jgi:hypothetical protein